jgi:recombination protein RecT
MEKQFGAALPAHIPAERFIRVCMTAIQNNQKLLACSKQSFFNAAMRCAQDGLLPDGREAAIVPFGEEDEGDGRRTRSDLAGYMPMVAGIRKKVRNSGELKDWHAHVVYEGDLFDYELGDDPYIRHKPKGGGRARKIMYAYSIAVFNDGTLSRDVMPIQEIEEIRKKFSRSKKGPWSVPESYPEMCIKTVVKHHSKSLPMSTDLDRIMHRDDALYDFKGAADVRTPVKPAERPRSVASALDLFAGDEPAQLEDQAISADQTEQTASESATTQEPQTDDRTAQAHEAAHAAMEQADPPLDTTAEAYQKGQHDYGKGMQKRATPVEYRLPGKTAEMAAWLKGWTDAEANSKA